MGFLGGVAELNNKKILEFLNFLSDEFIGCKFIKKYIINNWCRNIKKYH